MRALGLTSRCVRIYKLLLSEGKELTIDEIREKLRENLSRSTLARDLKVLEELGFVEKKTCLCRRGGYVVVYKARPIEIVHCRLREKLLEELEMLFNEIRRDVLVNNVAKLSS